MAEFTNWHKSSYSGGEGENCVEQGVSPADGAVGVRDTKRGEESPVLPFSSAAWSAFVADVSVTA
ncbi:DUF397 domain-containing protein [Streptomyces sp. NPDC056454]|uniref:DUF397 domain-containing protein n=1 Tax=Streptomyces sp. NPDC056454 TaxID=3345823 RepID=UPI0036A379FB